MPHPRYSSEEIARRGQAIYDQKIKEKVEPEHNGKVLVVDVETGDWEMDEDHLAAADRALQRHPGAALYAVRVGYPALARIGGRLSAPAHGNKAA